MADEQEPDDSGIDIDDLGDPISELRDLDESPATGFVSRLVNVLRRRDLSSHFVTLSWNGLGTVLLEFLKALFSIFEPDTRDRGDTS